MTETTLQDSIANNFGQLTEVQDEIKSKLTGLVRAEFLPKEYAENLYKDIIEFGRRSYIYGEDAVLVGCHISAETGLPIPVAATSGIPVVHEETLFSEVNDYV